LDSIEGQLKAVERKSIANVIESGRLLEMAFERCERGTFETWLKNRLGWSVRTARRYRDAFDFSAKLAESGLTDLGDLSISAFHLLVSLPPDSKQAKRIMDAAAVGRVTYSVAVALIEEVDAESEPPPPEPPKPMAEPETEPEPPHHDDAGDDDADAGDDVSGDAGGDADQGKDSTYQAWIAQENAGEPIKLLRRLEELLHQPHRNWEMVIKAVGPVKARAVVTKLLAVLDAYGAKNAIAAKADRAQARSEAAILDDPLDIPPCLRRTLN
jgi:hypothetical protein